MKATQRESLRKEAADIRKSLAALDESSKSYIKGFLAGAQAASQTQKEEQHAKEETRASGSSR